MTKEKAVNLLASRIEEIETLRNQEPFSPTFRKWIRDTEVTIEKIFGSNTRHLNDFKCIKYTLSMITEDTPKIEYDRKFYADLEEARSILQSMLEEIQQYGVTKSSKKSDNDGSKTSYTGLFLLLGVVIGISIIFGLIGYFVTLAALPLVMISITLIFLIIIVAYLKIENRLNDNKFLQFLNKILESLPLLRHQKITEKDNDK